MKMTAKLNDRETGASEIIFEGFIYFSEGL